MSLFTGQKTWTPTIEEVTGNGDTLNNLQKFTMGAGASRWEANISDGMWLGADTFATAPFSVDFLGALTASSVTIKNNVGTVLIDSNSSTGDFVNVLNTKLNTNTQTILSDFTFEDTDYAGAFKTGDITWNTSTGAVTGGTGGVWNEAGLIFAAAGVPKITLDTATGNATFAGTVAGASGTFGEVTAGTFTGCVFQSAKTLYRVKMSTAGFQTLNGETVLGSINVGTNGDIVITGTDDVVFNAGGSDKYQFGGSSLKPLTTSVYKLGEADKRWSEIHGNKLYIGTSWNIDDDGTSLLFKYGSTEKMRINGDKIRPAGTYESSDGSDGIGVSGHDYVTSVFYSGGDLKYRYRELTFKDGILTDEGSEQEVNAGTP